MATTREQVVALNPMNLELATIYIEGITPLVTHRFSEKAKRQIREKKAGKKTKDRTPTDPQAEFEAAHYFLSDGSAGFPLTGIKKAMHSAAHKDLGIAKVLISKGIFIHGDEGDLIRINSESGPKMREDIIRVFGGQPDLRYRPEWATWEMRLRIEFDADQLTLGTIVNLLQRAGFGVGIGEGRPEKGGEWGRFRVKSEAAE
jgi:hypothetical protein